ncbi:MAG: hypothetical protein B0W54_22675 [Cellvibrio sp. 79]|nr:MAG: hypothetical protein B0W54_22675 [Cellvibrio sp. 79]
MSSDNFIALPFMVVIRGTLIITAEDVCELNIWQTQKETLTIQKLHTYLLLTKIFRIQINNIETAKRWASLVLFNVVLAKLYLWSTLG